MSDDLWIKSLIGGLVILVFGVAPSKGNTDECSLCCILPGITEDLNCTWTDNISLQLDVWLESYDSKGLTKNYSVPPGQPWLLIPRGDLTLHYNYQLSVHGGSWMKTLNFTFCHGCENVFIKAPVLSFVLEEDVEVSWGPIDGYSHPLVVELRYRILGDRDWILVNSNDLEPESYAMTDPQPYTDYEFQIRCIPDEHQKSGSLWSEIYVLTTPEKVPNGIPDIWRRVNMDKSLLITWKPLSHYSARGKILSYNVTFVYNNMLHTAEKPCCSITLPAQSTHVCVSARNSMGPGPDGCVTPLCSEAPDKQDCGGEAFGDSSGRIVVVWKEIMTSGFPVSYLVEWRKNNSLEMDWTRSPTANQTLVLPGEFSPGILYLISIYALYDDSCVKIVSTEAYAKEEAPLAAPNCSIHVVSSSEASISWNKIPSYNLRGKLKHYTIYVNSTTDLRRYTVHEEKMTLSELLPNTWYNIFITASTAAGEGVPSEGRTFQTKGVRTLHPLILSFVSLFGLSILAAIIAAHPCVRKTFLRVFWPKIPKPDNKVNSIITSSKFWESQQTPPNPFITEVEEVKPVSPPPQPDPHKAIKFGYEKHFMPTPEEVMGFC